MCTHTYNLSETDSHNDPESQHFCIHLTLEKMNTKHSLPNPQRLKAAREGLSLHDSQACVLSFTAPFLALGPPNGPAPRCSTLHILPPSTPNNFLLSYSAQNLITASSQGKGRDSPLEPGSGKEAVDQQSVGGKSSAGLEHWLE